MATPDRGLRDKALNIINNVGNYGPLDATIDSYKQAADYADDARKYAELALSGVSDLETQIEKVTELATTVDSLEVKVEASFNKVTSLDVDAVDGSSASAVYDKDANKIHFTLPKGADGKDGTNGEDGKSAYQSYLDTTTDNPKKTESEWIASLKGKDGVDGKDGKDGANGTNGSDGRSAYELAVIGGYTGTLEDFNNLNTKSLDKNQNLSDLTNVASARSSLDVYSKEEVDSDITNLNSSIQTSLSGKAAKGANTDITALSGLTVALSVAQGGTGGKTAADARTGLSAAKSGANSDITSLSGLTTPLSISQGGTGSSTASDARNNLGLGSVATESVVPVSKGGTGASTATEARDNIGAASSVLLKSLSDLVSSIYISKTPSGYLRIPGNESVPSGFLLQWGVSAGDTTVYFPTEFQIGCFGISGTVQASLANYLFTFMYDNLTSGSFNAHPRFLNNTANPPIIGTPSESYTWIAWGV